MTPSGRFPASIHWLARTGASPPWLRLFNAMGAIMGGSSPRVEKLVSGANDDYVVECQHIRTNRPDRPNLDQQMSVLWRFIGGTIVSGQHLVGD